MNDDNTDLLSIIDSEKDSFALPPGALSDAIRDSHATVRRRADEDGLLFTYENGVTKPYAIGPGFCCLHARAEEILQARMKTIVGALEKIVGTYHSDAALQEFLAIPPSLKRWVMQDRDRSHLKVDLCRFDMMGSTLGDVRIIEFNANCPSGVGYHGLLTRYWRERPEVNALIEAWKTVPGIQERQGWFGEWLTEVARRRGVEVEKSVTIVHARNGITDELPYLIKCLQRDGFEAQLIPIDELKRTPGTRRFVYPKYSMQRTMRDIERWEELCRGIVEGDIVSPLSLSGRWIGENKLCLAVMSDPRFTHLFSAAERDAIERMIPWSRKLGDSVDVDEVVANKNDFVIKNPYDARGTGVFLGYDHTEDAWKEIVTRRESSGFLVQQYVDTKTSDVGGASYYRDLMVVIASGNVASYASRMSKDRVVNVAKGGARTAVFSCLANSLTDRVGGRAPTDDVKERSHRASVPAPPG